MIRTAQRKCSIPQSAMANSGRWRGEHVTIAGYHLRRPSTEHNEVERGPPDVLNRSTRWPVLN